MKKAEILKYAKECNLELDKEVNNLSGNVFFSLRDTTSDLTIIYRDQKDGNFFIIGLYPSVKANKLMENVKFSR